MDFLQLNQWSRWLLYLILPLIFVFLLFIKRFVFHFLLRGAKRTKNSWDDAIFKAGNFPLTLLLGSLMIRFVPVVFLISNRWEKLLSLTSQLLVIVALAFFVQKVLGEFLHRYFLKQETLKTYSGITHIFISITIYAIFGFIFLDTAGISITPLVASLGVGSVAIALALQDTLSSFFSGIYLVIDKPVRVGDFVKLESGEEGYVEFIGWRSVRIRMLPNNTVIIPNSKLAGSVITNYHLPEKEMAVLVSVGVDYSSDLEKVEQITIEVGREVMKTVTGGVPAFEPFIRYHTFGDSSINFTVILRAREFVDQYLIKHEFIKRLHCRYDKEGITIPFPIRTVHMETGDNERK